MTPLKWLQLVILIAMIAGITYAGYWAMQQTQSCGAAWKEYVRTNSTCEFSKLFCQDAPMVLPKSVYVP